MKFYSRRHLKGKWNYTFLFCDTRKYVPRHPKDLPHLTGIEEYVVLNYLLKQGWAFSVDLELYTKYPDIYSVEGFSADQMYLVWVKPTYQKKRSLSSLEYKSLNQIAQENQCLPAYLLIRTKQMKLVRWLTGNRYEWYWAALSNMTMF